LDRLGPDESLALWGAVLVGSDGKDTRRSGGVGCSTDGDILGLSPNRSDDPDNWFHS